MKKILLFMLIIFPVLVFSQDMPEQIPTTWDKLSGFLSDINLFNIALIAFATFAGGLWAMGRNKIKQVGELFLKAYEYTDDKRLSKQERQDLMQRFMEIIGRKTVLKGKK